MAFFQDPVILGCKIEKSAAKAFQKKAEAANFDKSEVLRELVRMFLADKIKIEKTA